MRYPLQFIPNHTKDTLTIGIENVSRRFVGICLPSALISPQGKDSWCQLCKCTTSPLPTAMVFLQNFPSTSSLETPKKTDLTRLPQLFSSCLTAAGVAVYSLALYTLSVLVVTGQSWSTEGRTGEWKETVSSSGCWDTWRRDFWSAHSEVSHCSRLLIIW